MITGTKPSAEDCFWAPHTVAKASADEELQKHMFLGHWLFSVVVYVKRAGGFI